MKILHGILNLLLVFSATFVFLSENPIYSVLFLILSFCNSSIIMFLFHLEFLGLLFIIIYVGAVAVLFLFVIMMLNVKMFLKINLLNIPLIIFVCIGIFLEIFLLIDKFFFKFDINTSLVYFDVSFIFIDNLSNIDIVGQSLYNYFAICFLISGLILLVAILGAIVLTLHFKTQRKNELSSRQLSKASNFLNHIL